MPVNQHEYSISSYMDFMGHGYNYIYWMQEYGEKKLYYPPFNIPEKGRLLDIFKIEIIIVLY